MYGKPLEHLCDVGTSILSLQGTLSHIESHGCRDEYSKQRHCPCGLHSNVRTNENSARFLRVDSLGATLKDEILADKVCQYAILRYTTVPI